VAKISISYRCKKSVVPRGNKGIVEIHGRREKPLELVERDPPSSTNRSRILQVDAKSQCRRD